MGGRSRRKVVTAATSIGLLLALNCASFGTEKSVIAIDARAVIQGQLIDTWSFPWRDGWHVHGTLNVTRSLWGPVKAGEKLAYRFVCDGCPFWPRPDLNPFLRIEKLWFLKTAGTGIWQSAGVQSGDPGVRGMEDVAYFEEILRLRKAEGAEHPGVRHLPGRR